MERIELDKVTPLIRAEHAHRYRWAASLARGRVLDAACGVGYGAPILAQNSSVTHYTGIDRSHDALAIATRDFADAARSFVEGDVYKLPFADGSFDTVVSLETIEHLEDPARAIAEFKRVLAPGGILLGSVPSQAFELACRDAYGPNEHHKSEFDDEAVKELVGTAFLHSVQWDCWLQIVSVLGPRQGEPNRVWNCDSGAGAMRRLGSILFAAASLEADLPSEESLQRVDVYPATSVVEHERLTITWRDRTIRGQERTIGECTTYIARLEDQIRASAAEFAGVLERNQATIAQLDNRVQDYAAANARQKQMIDERVALIKKQDELVALRDATIAQQKTRLQDFDQALTSARARQAEVEEQALRDHQELTSKAAALQGELSTVQAALRAALAESASCQSSLAQTQRLLEESKTLVKHQADLIDKRTAFIKNLEAMIVDRDQAIRNQTLMIQERDTAIKNQTRMIDDRDAAIKKQTEMIDARDVWIRNLRAEIAALKGDLERQKSWSASLEVTLAERDLSLMQFEARLNERDILLSDTRAQYSSLMSELDRPLYCLKRTAKAMVKKVQPSGSSPPDATPVNGGSSR